MKVLVISSVHACATELLKASKEHNLVIVKAEEIERPKEEVFLIHELEKVDPIVDYYPIKEQQPWRNRRSKNNYKSKRLKK